MCFKNRNLQNDSKVKTCKECIDDCKECIDKKTLDSISSCIGFFYVLLAAIPVLDAFIFYEINDFNIRKVTCLFIFIFILILFIATLICFYVHAEKVECTEIYDDLKSNINHICIILLFASLCGVISANFQLNCVTKINVSLAFMLVTCFIGLRAKYYNNKYALTKIDIDYMPTTNKYSKIGEHERESKLLVISKSYLKYYKVMETNYLMMSAFFVFVTSVLGTSSISSLQNIASCS